VLTSPDWAKAAGLTAIPCCEYTAPECCHVLGIGVSAAVAPGSGVDAIMGRRERVGQAETRTAILQDGVDQVVAAGGIPVLCHPFWHWAYGWREAAAVHGWRHVEICNASPDCNSYPLPGVDPASELWDGLLSHGRRILGLATDDAHFHAGPYEAYRPCGGRGWICVKAKSAAVKDLVDAIRDGHFYASTGVVLEEYRVTSGTLRMTLGKPFPACTEVAAFEFFGGADGRLLRCDLGQHAEYRFQGNETYVRCRIRTTAGTWAWTQPVWLDDVSATAWTLDND
jgi:hypothetical protein